MFAQPHHQISLQQPCFLHNLPPRQATRIRDTLTALPRSPLSPRRDIAESRDTRCDLFLSSWFGKPWSSIQRASHGPPNPHSGFWGITQPQSHRSAPRYQYTALLDVKLNVQAYVLYMTLTAFYHQCPPILPSAGVK